MTTLPRIGIITTGGTIDALGASRLDLAWYTETRRRLNSRDLIAELPELADVARVEIVSLPFDSRPSYTLSTADWVQLARVVGDRLRGDSLDGLVITHGTNTLEETAYFLHLTLRTPKPVVLTGAMRPANALSSDGALNLLRAVQVAATQETRRKGALVVLNETIHTARHVTKTHTFDVQAFQSPSWGPLGRVEADGTVRFRHDGTLPSGPGKGFDLTGREDLPRVDVIVSYVGADGYLVDAAVAAGAVGIVSAGTGAGRTTPLESEAYDRAINAGVVVCQSTRVTCGRVSRSPQMRDRRIVTADDLPPWKAKVLLALALTRTRDVEQIQRTFDLL